MHRAIAMTLSALITVSAAACDNSSTTTVGDRLNRVVGRLDAKDQGQNAQRPAQAAVADTSPDIRQAADQDYSTEYQSCLATGEAAQGVTAAMADCNAVELEKQDSRLNRAYKAAMSALEPEQRARLLAAQRAWIKFRDSKCEEDLVGGTMDVLTQGSCHLEMTTKRAAELEAMIDTSGR